MPLALAVDHWTATSNAGLRSHATHRQDEHQSAAMGHRPRFCSSVTTVAAVALMVTAAWGPELSVRIKKKSPIRC
jgi:hypothetical protein